MTLRTRKLNSTTTMQTQELDQLTTGKRLQRLKADYQTAKDEVTEIVNESGNDLE